MEWRGIGDGSGGQREEERKWRGEVEMDGGFGDGVALLGERETMGHVKVPIEEVVLCGRCEVTRYG